MLRSWSNVYPGYGRDVPYRGRALLRPEIVSADVHQEEHGVHAIEETQPLSPLCALASHIVQPTDTNTNTPSQTQHGGQILHAGQQRTRARVTERQL